MIYKNMQFLEAGAGDPEKIDILESVGLWNYQITHLKD
jgi:hypothetical protein